MDIHSSYNMLLKRSWIHVAKVIASYLLQRVKFIINGGLVIVKVEETLSMIKNVTVPYIETKDNTNINLHDFEVVNAKLVFKNTMLIKPRILKVAKIVVKYLLKHELPFKYDLNHMDV